MSSLKKYLIGGLIVLSVVIISVYGKVFIALSMMVSKIVFNPYAWGIVLIILLFIQYKLFIRRMNKKNKEEK